MKGKRGEEIMGKGGERGKTGKAWNKQEINARGKGVLRRVKRVNTFHGKKKYKKGRCRKNKWREGEEGKDREGKGREREFQFIRPEGTRLFTNTSLSFLLASPWWLSSGEMRVIEKREREE